MKLESSRFLEIVKSTPLVSIDLVILSASKSMLVGRRVNEPAKDTWFVPGGRIRKDETIKRAFCRICKDELNQEIGIQDSRLIGAFDHKYDTNFAGVKNISTQYIVLAYGLFRDIDLNTLPRTQHSE